MIRREVDAPLPPEPPPYGTRTAPVLATAAEQQTARRRCCIPGCQLGAVYRAVVVARPDARMCGGYAQFTTPHRTCIGHRDSPYLTADLIARQSEQEPLRHWAALRYGWDAAQVVFSATTLDGPCPA